MNRIYVILSAVEVIPLTGEMPHSGKRVAARLRAPKQETDFRRKGISPLTSFGRNDIVYSTLSPKIL